MFPLLTDKRPAPYQSPYLLHQQLFAQQNLVILVSKYFIKSWHLNRNLPKVQFLGLVVAMSATKCDLNCVTNFMQPICILCNFVFSDVETCQNTSKSHLFIDLTSQAPLSCT